MENNFKQIEKKYRPLPFWSWNEKLDTNETKRQIELMHEAGLGGFFMHARGGLQTEYMGKEWFENISLGISDAKKAGMQAWAYDENGWPSGFGNGLVNGLGVSYQQKYLRLQEGTGDTETTIINLDGYHLYYEINPFYVDTLDAKVTDAFIDAIYTKYYDIYKNETPGFFIDEPQVSRDGIPWSFIMPSEYKNRYGDELLPLLLQLFKPIGDYKKTRYNFWKMVTDLFSQNFTKRIYDWCDSHDMCFTGHMVLEEELLSQLTSNGAVMPNYEYFHIPGMDWLGRQIKPITTPLQVSSVAHQLGKKQILSETFALTGWNITFEEFKWLAEWQMVRGITLLCPHLEGYSLRGIRKRDYPPSIFYQQPWWKDYKDFVDYISRVGKILTDGAVKFDTLIIHPQSTAWLCYDDDKNEGIEYYNAEFIRDLETLEKAHCLFHIGDETLMERHCHVLGDTIVFGTQTYKTLVIPKHLVFSENTNNLISEFKKNGGNVVNATDVMPSKVIDNGEISMTVREFEDYKIYYFVNSTDKKQNAILNIDGYTEILNLNGETELFGRETYVFEPFESILILEYFKDKQLNQSTQSPLSKLELSGKWKVDEMDLNSLTLDYCKYSFNGKVLEEHGHVSAIQGRACAMQEPVNIEMTYNFSIKSVPKTLFLVLETPEKFNAEINGSPLNLEVCGTYRDESFKKVDIAKYVNSGENEIKLSINFTQSPDIYESIKKAAIFESEKNKLTYDTEIEAIYLVGDFSVATNGNFTELDKDAVRCDGDFTIDAPVHELSLESIEQQGLPFFAGSLKLSKIITVNTNNYCLKFDRKYANSIRVFVNGVEVKHILWRPYFVDLSDYLNIGENKIELELTNSLRNLLGPHHLEEGESYAVCPCDFFCEENIWGNKPWNDEYCFVKFGLKLN